MGEGVFTAALREAIRASGQTLTRIAEGAKVERASLSRFAAGKRSLRLDMADKLAAYFGLSVTGGRPKGIEGRA